MKRLLFIILIVLGLYASGQVNPTMLLRVANNTTAFGINLPIGTFIHDVGANKLYVLTAAAISTATLTTATKSEIGGASDHGALSGLSDDDHTQYALLAGRAGNVLNIDTIQDVSTGSEVVFKDDIWVYGTGTTDNWHVLYFGKDNHNYLRSFHDYLESTSHFLELHTEDILATGFSLFAEGASGVFNFKPSATTTVNLGTSSYKWNKFYSKNITDDASTVAIGSILSVNGGTETGKVYLPNSENYIEGSTAGTTSYLTMFVGSSYGLTYSYNSGDPFFSPDLLAVDLGGSSTPFDKLYTAKISDNGTCVGINNNSPGTTYELNVTGDINLTGNLTFDGAGSTIDAWTTSISSDDDTDVPTEGAVYDAIQQTTLGFVNGSGSGDRLSYWSDANTLTSLDGLNLVNGYTELQFTSTTANRSFYAQSGATNKFASVSAIGNNNNSVGINAYGSAVAGTLLGQNIAGLSSLTFGNHDFLMGSVGNYNIYIGVNNAIVARISSSGFGLSNYASLNADALTSSISSDDDTDIPTEGAVYDRTTITDNYVVVGTGTGIEGTSNFTYTDNTQLLVRNSSYDLYWNTSGLYGTSGGGSPMLGTSSARWQKLWTGGADFSGSLQFNQAGSLIDAFTETITADDDTDLPTEGAVYNYAFPKASSGTWKVLYSNGTNVWTELALGAANTYLMSNGVSSAPTFETPSFSEVDGSVTNEGSLTVVAGGSDDSQIQSNTSGSTNVTLSAGDNIDITETGSTITVAAEADVVDYTGTQAQYNIAYFNEAGNTITGEAAFTYDASTNTLTADKIVTPKRVYSIVSSDNDWTGDAMYYPYNATEDGSIGMGKVLYLQSDGDVFHADADAASTMTAIGVALEAKISGSGNILVLIRGTLRYTTWSISGLTTGYDLFVSTTTGDMTVTAPNGDADIVQVVGKCIDATNEVIEFHFDPTFIEVDVP